MLRAKESFYAAEVYVHEGQEFAASDPLVKGREALFAEVEGSETPAPKKRTNRKP
jgi:hypothetical protein